MTGRPSAALATAAVTAAAAGLAGAAAAMPTSFSVVAAHVGHSGIFSRGPSAIQTRAGCARFRLTDPAALRYFVRAHEVDERRWRETLDWTGCSAMGSLRTGDGKTYRWSVDQGGRGEIAVTPTVSVYLDGPEFTGAR